MWLKDTEEHFFFKIRVVFLPELSLLLFFVTPTFQNDGRVTVFLPKKTIYPTHYALNNLCYSFVPHRK